MLPALLAAILLLALRSQPLAAEEARLAALAGAVAEEHVALVRAALVAQAVQAVQGMRARLALLELSGLGIVVAVAGITSSLEQHHSTAEEGVVAELPASEEIAPMAAAAGELLEEVFRYMAAMAVFLRQARCLLVGVAAALLGTLALAVKCE